MLTGRSTAVKIEYSVVVAKNIFMAFASKKEEIWFVHSLDSYGLFVLETTHRSAGVSSNCKGAFWVESSYSRGHYDGGFDGAHVFHRRFYPDSTLCSKAFLVLSVCIWRSLQEGPLLFTLGIAGELQQIAWIASRRLSQYPALPEKLQ